MLLTNLLTNMVVVSMGIIQTNTPAFRNFEFSNLMVHARALASDWHLDTNLISSNLVTRFSARADFSKPSAEICFGERDRFWSVGKDGFGFSDEAYCWPDYSGRVFPKGDPLSGDCVSRASWS